MCRYTLSKKEIAQLNREIEKISTAIVQQREEQNEENAKETRQRYKQVTDLQAEIACLRQKTKDLQAEIARLTKKDEGFQPEIEIAQFPKTLAELRATGTQKTEGEMDEFERVLVDVLRLAIARASARSSDLARARSSDLDYAHALFKDIQKIAEGVLGAEHAEVMAFKEAVEEFEQQVKKG